MSTIEIQDEMPALPGEKREAAPALPQKEGTEHTVPSVKQELPPFQFHGIFTSHMVLQRQKPLHIWGFSRHIGKTVSVTFMGETESTAVTPSGKWEVTFSPKEATKCPQTMTATLLDMTLTLEDILIGDVWLIGGQSNAEVTLNRCLFGEPTPVFDPQDNFRLFAQSGSYICGHKECWGEKQENIVQPNLTWKKPDEAASLSFSALGWHFAKELTKHTPVPQGMIMMCCSACCLFDLASPEFAHKRGFFHGGRTGEGGLYHGLIHPLAELSFFGQLFFQGESEGCDPGRSRTYGEDFIEFIEEERNLFHHDFPLLYVQLCSYRQEGAEYFPYLHWVRLGQYHALEGLPNAYIFPSMDLESPPQWEDWAHSPKKTELGKRLAKAALALYYGVGNTSHALTPLPAHMALSKKGTHMTLRFENVGDGLCVRGLSPKDSTGKEVAGFAWGDGYTFAPVSARILNGNTVEIPLPTEPSHTQLAYAPYLVVTEENANLVRSDNTPPVSFSLPILIKTP